MVHFDGHGTYLDPAGLADGSVSGLAVTRFGVLGPVEPGPHGYLLFEQPDSDHNQLLVGGSAVGALLVRTGVAVLLLNACRSAYAEAPPTPAATDAGDDPDQRVRAYGSLALEVTGQGVAGVVAMRYNVWVVTAAQFVADLYTALLNGQPLGSAVSAGRRQLAASPDRTIAYRPVPLQDWSVPVVYEAAPVPILARPAATAGQPRIVVSPPAAGRTGDGAAVDGLPHRPDVGFFGRDETLLALDRAFDKHRIVLLHGYAGSGKTTTAVELARWYATTGGLTDPTLGADGTVVFSSLEHHTPLPRLLNDWAAAHAPLLAANGIAWDAVTDPTTRRSIAVQVMTQVPVLWIWDNVEPVAGFPTGTPSAWTPTEQADLAGFLRDLAATKARVLLTSRRDEQAWLGQLPTRVKLPPMPMREMTQLTAALAARHNHHITDVADWRPLLRYTAGNPLTITIVVGQVLREGLTTRKQIDKFVARLRAGETDPADDETQGRTRSLGASLGYGFATAFTDHERAQLAVLHLFQDTVTVIALVHMGHPDSPAPVPALAGLTRQTGTALLDRAADLGLLTSYGSGYYQIHPALPWYFRDLFTTHRTPTATATAVNTAYTAAIAALGNYYHRQYQQGQTGVIATLGVEEANLRHARALARTAGRWADVIGCMQGLRTLYEHVGRHGEWARLVDELTPDLADPTTDQPLPGREDHWAFYTDYRMHIAYRARDWPTATRLQHTLLAWSHDQARDALATPIDQLTDQQRNHIRNLSASEQATGKLLRKQRDPACLDHLQQALDLSQRINDSTSEATTAFNLGHAHLAIPGLRDLDRAEHWYRHALNRYEPNDQHRRARATGQLGQVAYERFLDARTRGEPIETLIAHLTEAACHYHDDLDLLPADATPDIATAHHQLGVIYEEGGRPDTALTHWQQAIRHCESVGDRYRAGRTRYNIALMLTETSRATDALAYAHAALRDLEPYRQAAATDIAKTRRLIAELDARPAGP
ncbi:MAG TPA: tetratricopeptide repeat protein [Micromonosporaceae bacterium]|nr:tetratricopeptide repeat protein [Micromonosporaceae bacterium]